METLPSEGLVAGRIKKRTRQSLLKPGILPRNRSGVSHFTPGELVQVHIVRLFPENTRHSLALWIRIERCDPQRRIVFGTIEGESLGLDKALRAGAKLAVSYDLVR